MCNNGTECPFRSQFQTRVDVYFPFFYCLDCRSLHFWDISKIKMLRFCGQNTIAVELAQWSVLCFLVQDDC